MGRGKKGQWRKIFVFVVEVAMLDKQMPILGEFRFIFTPLCAVTLARPYDGFPGTNVFHGCFEFFRLSGQCLWPNEDLSISSNQIFITVIIKVVCKLFHFLLVMRFKFLIHSSFRTTNIIQTWVECDTVPTLAFVKATWSALVECRCRYR